MKDLAFLFKFIIWAVVLLGSISIGYNLWHHMETRALRAHAEQVAANAQFLVSKAFMEVLYLQGGGTYQKGWDILPSPDPMRKTMPAVSPSTTAAVCGQIVVLRGPRNEFTVSVPLGNCTRQEREFLKSDLVNIHLPQLLSPNGLNIDGHRWRGANHRHGMSTGGSLWQTLLDIL